MLLNTNHIFKKLKKKINKILSIFEIKCDLNF